MKLFALEQLRQWDRTTIDRHYENSAALMEVAAKACADALLDKAPAPLYIFFCGTGNNGGDGLVMARTLLEQEHVVVVYVVGDSSDGSPDFRENLQLCIDGDVPLNFIAGDEFELSLPAGAVIVDALFGSGLNRPIKSYTAAVITAINEADCMVVAVDIPSGLQADLMEPQHGAIVKANLTLCIETPKRSMLFAENFPYVGSLYLVPIGLDGAYQRETHCNWHYYDEMNAMSDLRVRSKFDHKGDFGHLGIVAGSKGMMGAAVLCNYAALRAGVGKVTAQVPICGLSIMQTSVPEAMAIQDASEDHFSAIQLPDTCNAFCIGPGLGRAKATTAALNEWMKNMAVPCILDADALNFLAADESASLPKNALLTPHVGEFDRLFGNHATSFDRLRTLMAKAKELSAVIVLKGAHSITATPSGEVFFNSTGNAGMATAGSGDVLSGMIGALLAQGYEPSVAARLGVFLHGLAGDVACEARGSEAMIARDIIEFIGDAFQQIQHLRHTIR
jgi:NAD(P)H-hydrate epimerase